MRRFLTPRWLALHLLAVVLAAACLALGYWQLTRAEGGNALSWGYTFEWPVFAVFVLMFWGKLVRDARRGVSDRDAPRLLSPVLGTPTTPPEHLVRAAERALDRVPDQAALAPGAPARAITAPGADAEDRALERYNEYLAWLNADPQRDPREYPG